MSKYLSLALFFVFSFQIQMQAQSCSNLQNTCANSNFANSFIYSEDPNTIEYDNFTMNFHDGIIRTTDSSFWIFGGPLLSLALTKIDSNLFPSIKGTVLKVSIAGHTQNTRQLAILTTDGLFLNNANIFISNTLCNPFSFCKLTVAGKQDGLPPNVLPQNVKMLHATDNSISLVTCDGQAWVLPLKIELSGDSVWNQSAQPFYKFWHRVRTNSVSNPYLEDVISLRASANTMLAMTRHGKLYTWGYGMLGDGTALDTMYFATPMSIPIGITPKLIGIVEATQNYYAKPSYYLVTTHGSLYAMGNNSFGQLGTFDTVTSYNWVRPRKSMMPFDFIDSVVWISIGVASSPVCAALLNNGRRFAWGENQFGQLGFGSSIPTSYPTKVLPTLGSNEIITAISMGGHISAIYKHCEPKIGLAGHTQYFMPTTLGTDTNYRFDTYALPECPAYHLKSYIQRTDTNLCIGESLSLKAWPDSGSFSLITSNALLNGNILTATGVGEIKVSYLKQGEGCGSEMDLLTLYPRDYGNLTSSSKWAYSTIWDQNKIWLGHNITEQPNADCSANLYDAADGVELLLGTIQVNGVGKFNDPWMVPMNTPLKLELNIGNGSINMQYAYWAVWADVDGNGYFSDAADTFLSGLTVLSPNTITGQILILSFSFNTSQVPSHTSTLRAVVAGRPLEFSKNLDGRVRLANGEIEDYFIKYVPAASIQNFYKKDVAVYPNPTRDLLIIVGLKNQDQIELFNSIGVRCRSVIAIDENLNLNVATLSSGVYSITIKRNGSIIYRNKIQKQ